jgi:uncharacterized protein (DUF885 family)
MKSFALRPFIGALILFTAAVRPTASADPGGDQAFQKLADDFLAGYLAWRPMTAVSLGLHEYDARFSDFTQSSLERELQRLKEFDEKLAAVPSAELSQAAANDLRVLRLAIAGERFRFEDAREYRRNPMLYAGALDLNIYLKRDFAPLATRLKSIIAIEEQTPALFAAARENSRRYFQSRRSISRL